MVRSALLESRSPVTTSYVDTSYDASGRVASVTNPYRTTSTGSDTYAYDGDGERVKKSSGTLYWNGLDGTSLARSVWL